MQPSYPSIYAFITAPLEDFVAVTFLQSGAAIDINLRANRTGAPTRRLRTAGRGLATTQLLSAS
jgi:hypothetical protein